MESKNFIEPVRNIANEIKAIVIDPFAPFDPLIVVAKKRLKGNDCGSCNHVGMLETKMDELDIRVTPALVDRALRFVDVLIKTLRARHHSIGFRNGDTYALVKGDDIKIRCHELSKRVVVKDSRFSSSELHPTGLLAFKAGNFTPREWKDNASNPARRLENFIPDIIAWLEKEADYWNDARAKHRRDEEERQRAAEAKLAVARRKAEEMAAFRSLLGDSERWAAARKLREYIDLAEQRGADPDWVAWARNKADWYDPFVAREDEGLGKWGLAQE